MPASNLFRIDSTRVCYISEQTTAPGDVWWRFILSNKVSCNIFR